MKKYCENPYCDAEATHKVLVSINTFSDGVRNLCMTCYEAYVWGVQHGKRYEAYVWGVQHGKRIEKKS